MSKPPIRWGLASKKGSGYLGPSVGAGSILSPPSWHLPFGKSHLGGGGRGRGVKAGIGFRGGGGHSAGGGKEGLG